MKLVQTYITDDGKQFRTECEARVHENEYKSRGGILFEKYLKTYNGNKLLENYDLDYRSIWQVLGEDPNCDFGGHHYQPKLGVFEGTLREVINRAVATDGFTTWGSMGDIIELKVVKLS